MVDARAGAGAQVLARLDMAVMMSSDFFLYGAVYGLGISLLCAIRPMPIRLSSAPLACPPALSPPPAPRPFPRPWARPSPAARGALSARGRAAAGAAPTCIGPRGCCSSASSRCGV